MVLGGLSFSFVNQKYNHYSDFFFILIYSPKSLHTMALEKLQTKLTVQERTTKVYFF